MDQSARSGWGENWETQTPGAGPSRPRPRPFTTIENRESYAVHNLPTKLSGSRIDMVDVTATDKSSTAQRAWSGSHQAREPWEAIELDMSMSMTMAGPGTMDSGVLGVTIDRQGIEQGGLMDRNGGGEGGREAHVPSATGLTAVDDWRRTDGEARGAWETGREVGGGRGGGRGGVGGGGSRGGAERDGSPVSSAHAPRCVVHVGPYETMIDEVNLGTLEPWMKGHERSSTSGERCGLHNHNQTKSPTAMIIASS